MKILLTGKNGQVGYELERSLQGLGQVMAVDRTQMDLADLMQVRDVIRTLKPDLIVNAAAYTAVDKAESEPALAMRINADAPGVMAEEAKRLGAIMIHYSSDYVFDGSKDTPYVESDQPCPLNVYGTTKLMGERAIQAVGIPHLILRTSWVYGMRGRNFLLSILHQAEINAELRVVTDQHGAPTWCRTIADATARIVKKNPTRDSEWKQKTGVYHLAAQGQTTWYDFAKAILTQSYVESQPVITAIHTEDRVSLARRPHNSMMSCNKFIQGFFELPQWDSELMHCFSCK
ncbi:dTDP-4-dehydrorhamnose reductase [Paraherbaspirillum soli]|uniref:dTDP-4-dehydrorhamnose reductase n=1 Tax=Paraherbaspirillum soli TaxID=631222 RepID=A0ABW0MDJ7_9BURK